MVGETTDRVSRDSLSLSREGSAHEGLAEIGHEPAHSLGFHLIFYSLQPTIVTDPVPDRRMRPLRMRLQEARQRLGIPWEILDRDYLLSWVLAGIGQISVLRDTLVCKGGTALKECCFEDYYFLEDLDPLALKVR